MAEITMKNFEEKSYDIFRMFNERGALLTAGTIDDYNTMTIGWGMFGTVWDHSRSAVTVYVSPDRYTYEYMEKNEYFTITFFPEEYRDDLMYLGSHSGRDEDKVAKTRLTPVVCGNSTAFKEAELTFLCRKVYAYQFEAEQTPEPMRSVYQTRLTPHYAYIGFIEDVSGEIE